MFITILCIVSGLDATWLRVQPKLLVNKLFVTMQFFLTLV